MRPRDDKGRFVPLNCPVCGCGTLRLEVERGASCWRCDGLLDPENDLAPLEACYFTHFDGDHYSPTDIPHP